MKKWCPMKRILFSIVCIFLIPAVFAEAGMADKNAPLIQAAEKGNLPEVQVALDNGADINATLIKKYYGIFVKGVTALIAASENGHAEIVKLLLNKGANLKAKTTIDDIDYTALGIAKMKGKKDIIEILEKAGAKE
jgi:ankyrin repeat protein